MSLHSVPRPALDFFPSRPVEFEVSAAPLSGDAGLLVIRQFDEQIRLTERFAAALEDRRHPTFTRHSLLTMVRQRIFGILADYEDQNDHDTLRSDPVFKLIADRLPDDPDLASQPTLSRFENAVSIAGASLGQLTMFICPFLPPGRTLPSPLHPASRSATWPSPTAIRPAFCTTPPDHLHNGSATRALPTAIRLPSSRSGPRAGTPGGPDERSGRDGRSGLPRPAMGPTAYGAGVRFTRG